MQIFNSKIDIKMKKSDIKKMPDYFDRYINLAEDVSVVEALQISLQELENAPLEKWKALGEKTYAPDKWTVKDILQHYIVVPYELCLPNNILFLA
jgi:hypothetical protein